jgi:phage N-6-adenine-methyltransferase
MSEAKFTKGEWNVQFGDMIFSSDGINNEPVAAVCNDITPWINKAIEQMEFGRLTVMLLPADTSVKWFKLAFDNCTECHFISGRLAFINEETGKPVNGNNKGSVVFIFDPHSPIKQAVSLIDRDEMMKALD